MKPPNGGLGFVVAGKKGRIVVKSISPGSVAEKSGKLKVGDRLLQVSYLLTLFVCLFVYIRMLCCAPGVIFQRFFWHFVL